MATPIKCRLIFHGQFKEINMGIFLSKSDAKKCANECWDRPYTIIPVKVKQNPKTNV